MVGCFLPWCRSWAHSRKQPPIKRKKPNWWSQQWWLGKVRRCLQKCPNRDMANKQTSLVYNYFSANEKVCAPLARLIQVCQLSDLRESFETRWARHSTPRFDLVGRVRFKCDSNKFLDQARGCVTIYIYVTNHSRINANSCYQLPNSWKNPSQAVHDVIDSMMQESTVEAHHTPPPSKIFPIFSLIKILSYGLPNELQNTRGRQSKNLLSHSRSTWSKNLRNVFFDIFCNLSVSKRKIGPPK